MRLRDFTDYFVLRRFLQRPWEFLRSRKHPPSGPLIEVLLKNGGTVRLRNGAHDRHVFHRIFARDQYRLDHVPPGTYDTVIDIGGHVGSFSLRVAPLARRVLAFEPTPDSYDLLVQNIASYPHVRAFRLGVAGRAATMTLKIGVCPSRNSIFMDDPRSTASISIETVTLEEIFRQHDVQRCDLLKVDCEGAEYDILYSTPREIWSRIERTAIEYHLVTPARERWNGEALTKFLGEQGHQAKWYPPLRKGNGYIFSVRA